MHRANRLLRVVAPVVAALLTLCAGRSAWASFHLMKVREAYAGSAAAPNAQYVELQMYSANQTSLGGHGITVFSANGTMIGMFLFPATPLGPRPSQSTVLIATTEAATFFSITPDLTMTAILPRAGGKVCFDAIPVDCVAWGSYSGSAMGVGSPASPTAGLVLGRALSRRLDITPGTTTLEAADDTDQSANDFLLATPAPKNLAGLSGTIPPSTCGNGTVESLEPCDDGNGANTDACLTSCTRASCGDTFVHAGVEDCDDGNHTPNDGCSPTCTTELPDAGVPDASNIDAGPVDAAPDIDSAVATPDGALPGTPVSDTGGCGCRTAGSSTMASNRAVGLVVLLVLAFALIRRRDARRGR